MIIYGGINKKIEQVLIEADSIVKKSTEDIITQS